MENVPNNVAHCLRITYHGPTNARGSRWGVSWDGYQSQGPRTVRRYLPYDGDMSAVARQAVAMFLEWMNEPPAHITRYHTRIVAKRVTRGMFGGDYFVTVTTRVQREGDE